jgi:hypothetical protein
MNIYFVIHNIDFIVCQMTQKVKMGFTSQTINWLSKYDILIYIINIPYLILDYLFFIYKLTHNLSFVII